MMKNNINSFLKIMLFLVLIMYSFSATPYSYPYVKRINTGYYVIVDMSGLYLADTNLNINKSHTGIYPYSEPDNTNSQSLAQFPVEDEGYILIMRNFLLYLYTRNLVSTSNIQKYKQGSSEKQFNFKYEYNIFPYKHENDNFCAWVVFPENAVGSSSSNLIYLSTCFNKATKTSTPGEAVTFSAVMDYSSLQCKLMNENKDTIACIYGTNSQFSLARFKLDDFSLIDEVKTFTDGGKIFKIEVIPDENEIAIVCASKEISGSSNFKMYCVPYDITTNAFGTSLDISSECSSNRNNYVLDYFYESDEILAGCVDTSSKLHISKISRNYVLENCDTINLKTICSDFHRLNIVFPSNKDKYHSFTDCGLHELSIAVNKIKEFPIEDYSLDCTKNDRYLNYEGTKCIKSIPEGYYCNSTQYRTIDKCHDNCKTCEQGGANDNNNCLTCKDDLFYDLGNCRSSCTYGDYTDENNVKTCICSTNTKCYLCTIESNKVNKCVSCKTDSNYYPKEDDTGEFMNCYDSTNIPSNYYLDSTNKIYKLCHSLCAKCTEAGIDNNNKCTQCIEGYFFIMNINDIKNCYSNCNSNNYYYFDDRNNYHCENNCPSNYKLIDGQKKCIKDCTKENEFLAKLAYKNTCYKTCPTNTRQNGNICELYCKQSNKYSNYAQTECIDIIPDGFYCNDTTKNTINKCHDNCKTCSQGGTNTNNNCLTCQNVGKKYYSSGNCVESCDYYFYYDETNQRDTCTSENKCPTGYKLIDGSNKCIKNCGDESVYKYEYKDKCYASCRTELFTKPSDGNKCILACNLYNKYFNYGKTDCIDSEPEGYYCDNTELKTIDKCHDNCKTCSQGGTNDNNNCLTCKEGLFYDLGNCRSDCETFTYTDNIKRCKCSTNTTCEYCTIESNKQHLCITCNNGLNFYQMENDPYNKGDFINCYNEDNIEDYYLLDEENKIYKECYKTCQTCFGFGYEEDHKCSTCKYLHYPDKDNCHPQCDGYYYFTDDDVFHCVKTIPKGYMQIYDQPTLIKTCEEYLTYEYNNICYPRCPGYTVKTNDFKCVIDCKANDKYFNYEQTDCINSIPEGYYCNNQEKNTIEKCHQNCKSCEQGGTNDNNNCLVCKDGLFYDLGNCKSNCVNGELNGDIIKKCKCTQNKSCEKCSLESNKEDLCITCNNQDGYYMKADDEFLENGFVKCYENPEGYFLKDNKYHKC